MFMIALSAVAALVSCGSGNMGPECQDDGLVMVKAPSTCPFNMYQTATRAYVPDSFDALFIQSEKSIGGIHSMSKGSTLWLLIEEPSADYPYDESDFDVPSAVVEPDSWEVSETYSYKPYVVGDNGAMYPCETEDSTSTVDGSTEVYRKVMRDADGKIRSSGAALMLPAGLYRFHAVSPASPLLVNVDGEDQLPSVHLKNGEYVQATDIRWKESYPKGVLIRGGMEASGVQSVSLPALVNQTARIRVNIRCGRHVQMLGLQESGIEVSGIQEDDDSHFRWTMADTVRTRVGSKYGGLVVRESERKKDTDGNDMITAWASILPTDARTNAIYLLLHLMVNNVPTQYMIGLTNQLYVAANEYVYNFRVNMDGDVSVGAWDNISVVYEGLEL